MDSLRFDNSLERLTDLTDSTILNQPKEEMHGEKFGRVPNARLPPSSGMCYLPGISMCNNTRSIANQGSSLKRQCQMFN